MRVDDFILFLTSEKHYSPHTITAYRNDLVQFYGYIESIYGNIESKDIDHQIIRSWLSYLIQSGATARSANRKLSTLKSYFRFLIKREVILVNPMQKVVSLKTAKNLPVFIEKGKMKSLFTSEHFEADFKGVRNRIVLEMLYATGMRVSELIGLKHIDVDLASMNLRVTGKRNKQRIIPFGSYLSDAMNEFIKVKEEQFGSVSPDSYFIITEKGEKAYPKLIYTIVTQSLAFVTTQPKRSPHILRHSFATGMLNNGADLNAIKELLGHSSLAATQVYTHNTIERIKHIYQQAHPKA
ncbi:MAG: tyrosine-type recombinase/integrase [Bacteroidales bacterium]|nr:tyrosine-type recombinase/integrase [Bacteroidales bacterium]